MNFNVTHVIFVMTMLSHLRALNQRRHRINMNFFMERHAILERRRRRIRARLFMLRYLRMQAVMATVALGLFLHEDERQARMIWMRQRTSAVWDEMNLDMNQERWREHFRVSKETFMFICDGLRPTLQNDRFKVRQPLSVEKKVAIAIWRLATNVEFRTISTLFGVGRSTACRVTHEVTAAIKSVFEEQFLRFPQGDELLDTVRGFETRWRFPQVAGAIDGSHIPIIAPVEFPQDYYNRKGHYSIVLQAVVDYRYRFTDILVGWPGSVHDARILANSEVYRKGQNGTLFMPNIPRNINGVDIPFMLLGDPAYPLLPWLMKGFSDQGRLRPEQLAFNYRQSSARMVVECAFGRLKARWRCLLKRNDTEVSKMPTLVAACCILHNICEERGDIINPAWLEEAEREQPVNAHRGRELTAEGNRNALVNYFATGH